MTFVLNGGVTTFAQAQAHLSGSGLGLGLGVEEEEPPVHGAWEVEWMEGVGLDDGQ